MLLRSVFLAAQTSKLHGRAGRRRFALARPRFSIGHAVELCRDVGLAQSGARPYRFSSKGETDTSRYTLRIVVSTRELTVIINVGRKPTVPLTASPGPARQSTPTTFCPTTGKPLSASLANLATVHIAAAA